MIRILLFAGLLLIPVAVTAKPPTPNIDRWIDLARRCTHMDVPEGETREQVCATAEKFGKKMEARGYCIYGHYAVGVRGKRYFYPGFDSAGTNSHWTEHCYSRQHWYAP
jgi:hypothetical protein